MVVSSEWTEWMPLTNLKRITFEAMLTISSSSLKIAKLLPLDKRQGTASLSNTKQINFCFVCPRMKRTNTARLSILNGRLESEVSMRCYGKFAHFSFLSLLITLRYNSCWPALAPLLSCAFNISHYLQVEYLYGVGVALLQYLLPVAEILCSLDANSNSPQLQHTLFIVFGGGAS